MTAKPSTSAATTATAVATALEEARAHALTLPMADHTHSYATALTMLIALWEAGDADAVAGYLPELRHAVASVPTLPALTLGGLLVAVSRAMGTEPTTPAGIVMATTPEQIALVRSRAVAIAGKLEVETGIKMTARFSLIRSARGYGYTGRTKAGALAHMRAYNDHAAAALAL